MKNKFEFIVLAFLVAAFIGLSCGTDTSGTSNFASQAEADSVVAANSGYILDILYDLNNAAYRVYFNGYFVDRAPQARSHQMKKASHTASAVYDSVTGIWSDSYTQGDSIGEHYTIKFTPRNSQGLADTSTNTMVYTEDYNDAYTSDPYLFETVLNFAINATGVSGYRNETGNLNVNGSFDFSYVITNLADQSSITIAFNSDYHSIAIASSGPYYFQSGTADFTLKFDVKPSGAANFFVAGTFTFDGTHIVKLSVGGFNYNIDIDNNNSITPA